jgi:hypothetical protein
MDPCFPSLDTDLLLDPDFDFPLRNLHRPRFLLTRPSSTASRYSLKEEGLIELMLLNPKRAEVRRGDKE